MGASSSDLTLTPQGCATVSLLIFPRAPVLRRSLLRQDFLAQILICLPSRLRRALSFVWLAPHGCWGAGGLPGYYLHSRIFSSLFLVIQYQNNALSCHSAPPPCHPARSSNRRCFSTFSRISIFTPTPPRTPHHSNSERTRAPCLCYFSNFPSVSRGEGEHRARTVAATIAHQHADEMTARVKHKPVSRQAGVAPPRVIALWLLVTIVLLCSQALTSGDKGQRGK